MKNFLKYFKNYKLMTFLAPFLKMVEAIFELLVPFIVKDIIDIAIPNKDYHALTISVILLFALSILGLAVSITAQYMSAKVAINVTKDIRLDMFKKLQSLSYEDIDILGEDSLVNKLTTDTNQIQSGINMFLRLFLRSPFIVFGALIMSLIINLKLGIIFAIVIPLLFIIVYFVIIKSMPLFKKLQEKNDKTFKRTKDNVTGMKVVRAFVNEENEIKENKQEITDYKNYYNKVNLFTSTLAPITYLIINLAIIFIVYFGSKMLDQNQILKGDIVALYNYMGQILIELVKLANLSILLSKTLAAIKRFNLFMIQETKQQYGDDSINNESVIELKNVSFKYANTKENIINNANLKINKNEFIGIIGQTGSGKSTLINLLNKNYDVTSGNILINNLDISNFKKADIKENIFITNNNFFFLEDTIENNIIMSNKYDEDKLNKALELSLSKEIVNKKGGIKAIISEGGKNLSGGEKERIQIARAIYKDSSILIFDACLEALDANTLDKVIKNLKTLNKTIIIATDRISQIKDADKIIVLNNNMITGFDTHQNLLKSNNHYKEIYELSLGEEM